MKKFLAIVFCSVHAFVATAQTGTVTTPANSSQTPVAVVDSTNKPITVSGKIRDENGQPISNAIIINKRLKKGFFGKPDGSFSISALHKDTISVTSLGFHTREFTFKDSIYKTSYELELYLEFRSYVLPEVSIFAPRDLEKIQQDIEKLGYRESDYTLSGLDAARSPITFLYLEFSKREQSRREAARLTNEDKKRELLKELFHHYVAYDIIELSDEEFDDFIDYLHVSDEFMKNSSQYDFLIYVRDRFKDYKIQKRRQQPMQDTDYNYDKD